jgi:hypothetical protein
VRLANHPQQVVNAQVTSTSVADRLLVTAWYDGEQVTSNLPVSSFQINWSAERRVQGQATLVITDQHGNLTPTKLTDPLGVAGSRLRLIYQYGATGTEIPLGWWRIRRVTPHTYLQHRMIGGQLALVPGGGTIVVEADEETVSIDLDRLDPSMRQPTRDTVLTEVAHLAAPYLGIVIDPRVVDAAIRTVEYTENRLETIQVLLDQV